MVSLLPSNCLAAIVTLEMDIRLTSRKAKNDAIKITFFKKNSSEHNPKPISES